MSKFKRTMITDENGVNWLVCRKCHVILTPKNMVFSPGRIHTYCKQCASLKSAWNAKRNWYGITPEQYHEMLEEQSGGCYLCRKTPTDNRKLDVDHNHKTGKIRALLCTRCNSLIGQFEADADLLNKVVDYFVKFDGIEEEIIEEKYEKFK
jgi:hypothetical protein